MCISLGDFPTVYQMELYAIILCLERMKTKKIENKKMFIISDSQAAIINKSKSYFQTSFRLYT